MRPKELSKVSLEIEKMFYDLQDRIMTDVIRRLLKTGKITSTADYQLNRYLILGNSTEFIESEIRRITGMSREELWKVYDKVVESDYVRNKDVYEQINGRFVPPEENEWLKTFGEALTYQTHRELVNITQSMGFSLDYGNGRKVFTPLSEYYQKYLDSACMDVASGAFDYNTVLRRVVRQMTSSGLQYVDYASGYRSRAPVAARRAVLTGVHQLSNQINERVAKDLGTNDYEVTAHYGARLEHSYWQGGVYSYQELQTVCGLGTVTGLCGANCRHSYYPFVAGISVRSYTDEELGEMRRKDAETHSFNGKEYNAYGASQRQRQYETTMRAQRARVKALKEGKADDSDIMAARTRYLQTLHEYQRFSKSMNIPTQMERVYMDGLGRVAPGKTQMNKIVKISSSDNLFEKSKLSKVLGVDKDKIDFGEIDEKSKKSVYNGIKKVFEKFPQLKGHTKSIVYDSTLKAIASSDSIGGKLKLSSRFCEYAKLAKDYMHQTKLEWNPKGTTVDSIIVHELGHQLDGLLTIKGVLGGQIGQYGITRTSVAVEREVLQRLGYFDYIRAERADWKRMGYSGRELNEALEFSKKEFITKHISEYAYKNEREFFAECFSEYMTSKNPREAAKIFGEILEEIMEGLK